MGELLRKLKFLLRRDEFEQDMDEEMRHHLAMKTEESGSAETARRQFGNVTLLKENSRAMWTWTFWEQLAQDLRYGLRMMAANPLFTAMAALSLALGIGANTAIYSFMDAVLLRSLPVRHPEELVVLAWHSKDAPAVIHSMSGSNNKDARIGFSSPNFPFPVFDILRANHDVCSTLFAYQNNARFNLIAQGQAEIVDAQLVSGGYYAGLGVSPAVGRLIGDEDDRAGATPVAVLSYGYWQNRFAGNAAAVGQAVLINNVTFTIAGVSAPEFYGISPGAAPAIFLPLHAGALLGSEMRGRPDARFIDKSFYWVEMMGRLRPGVSRAQAQAALAATFHQFVEASAVTPREKLDLPALMLQEGSTGLDSLRRQFSQPLYVLMTLVGMILIIACANIANLLLARATSRRREMAVRLSVGAGRARVVRQLLTESLLLAGIGGLLGVCFAFWGVRLLSLMIAGGRENFSLNASLNWHVLAFTLVLSLGTGLLFGLAPAMQATRIDLTPALKETSSGALRGRVRRSFLRVNVSQTLVVLQVALSLLLLIAAGLFVRTLSNLQSVELGFNRQNLLLFRLNAKQAGYKDLALGRFYENVLNRVRGVPGVQAASMSQYALISGAGSSRGFKVADAAKTAGKSRETMMLAVGPQFFTTMQIPILLGREVAENDRPGSPLVAVVNEKLVKTFFGAENPIGQRFGFGNGNATDIEIVGVAKDARYNTLKRDIQPTIYTPYGQRLADVSQMFFEVRTAGDPLALANTVAKIVHETDAHIPVTNVRTQEEQIDQNLGQEHIFAQLCGCFAVLALAIACVGLYGTMAYTVARRTSEIGIRMALGAERRRIVWMVLREVLVLAALGLAIGLPTAYATTKFVKSFLFGMQPNDPLALWMAVGVLLSAAILAGYAPARRASKIDPMIALRHE